MEEILDNYTVLKKLGEHQKRKFGDVFLLQNKTTNELVVLKSILKLEKTLAIERFKFENKLSFNSIHLPYSSVLHESQDEYISLRKYTDGIELTTFWKTIKRQDKWGIILELCSQFKIIFEELSLQNIVHCDIKMSNILVYERENKLTFTLIDFGLGYEIGSDSNRELVFSLGSAAPEIILNKFQVVNQQTDFYAFGILIYNLLCGTSPFANSHPALMIQLCITYPLPDHNSLSKNQFTVLKKICAKHNFEKSPNKYNDQELLQFLEKGRDARYSKFSEFLIDIKNAKPRKKYIFF